MSNAKQDPLLNTIVNVRPGRRQFFKRAGIALVLLGLVGFAVWALLLRGNSTQVKYVTEDVSRSRLVVTVSATGNLQPTNQVDLGSELSGTIEKVFVEENDRVKKGQILAQLDLSKINDQVAKSRASVSAADAGVEQARATVAEARANLARLRHVAELSGGKVPSKTEMEAAEAAVLRAEASEANASAAVRQAKAGLNSDVTNISKGTIRSPIDGIVLARKVEPGQTVAASLQAPVLFTIAEDLAKMELQVDVDEAWYGEAGQPRPHRRCRPGRKYPATLTSRLRRADRDGVVSTRPSAGSNMTSPALA